jgi:PAS domain S-box-containing protein
MQCSLRAGGSMMSLEARKMGIDHVCDASWGSHFCLFYNTKEELIDVLVPYFKAGLENNEYCMWVTSEHLSKTDAKRLLKWRVKDLDEYLKRGQIEILDYKQWYTKSGVFDSKGIFRKWARKEHQALKMGFNGLRISGNAFSLPKEEWRPFIEYESTIDYNIDKHRTISLCTYSLEKCNPAEIADVVTNHQSTILKRNGDWETIVNTKRRMFEEAIHNTEEKFQILAHNARSAIIMLNSKGKISYWNPAAEEIFHYTADEAVGAEPTIVIPKRYHRDFKKGYNTFEKTVGGYVVGETVQSEAVRKGGEEFPIELHVSAAQIKGKCHVIAIVRDITDRRRDEKSVLERLMKYQLMFNNEKDVIMMMDVEEEKFLEVNKAVKNFYGYDREEFLDLRFSDISASSKKLEPNTKDLIGRSKGELPIFLHKKKDGTVFPVEISACGFKWRNRMTLCAIARDVTWRDPSNREKIQT